MPGLEIPTQASNPQKSYLTVKEIARRLKKDVDYVYRLIENGHMSAMKLPSSGGKRHYYLIDADYFEDWLKRHKVEEREE